MSEIRDARELLALLAAKPQHFAAAPGGVPYLTALDVAGALGMIHNRHAALYARVKYAGELAHIHEAASNLYSATFAVEGRDKWRQPRTEFIWDMCRLAVAEDLSPNICLWCFGRAEMRNNNHIIKCSACKGSGRREARESDRANLLNIPAPNWHQNWMARYREVRRIVDGWEGMIGGAVQCRLRA